MDKKRFNRKIWRIMSVILIFNLLLFGLLVFDKLEPRITAMLENDVENVITPTVVPSSDTTATNIHDSIPIDSIGQSYFMGHSYAPSEVKNPMTIEQHSDKHYKDEDWYGLDVSHWQRNIEWDKVTKDTAPHPLSFFIIKATQGITGVDPKFKSNWDYTLHENAIHGAYHFYIYKDDPVAQAKNYIKHVDLKSGDIYPIIDIEKDCAGCAPGISNEQMIKDLKLYIQTIEDHYKVKPILYTYSSFYREHLKDHFEDYNFWMAQYSKSPPSALPRKSKYIGKEQPNIVMWQFNSHERVKGIIGNVDMNYLPGFLKDKVVIP